MLHIIHIIYILDLSKAGKIINHMLELVINRI